MVGCYEVVVCNDACRADDVSACVCEVATCPDSPSPSPSACYGRFCGWTGTTCGGCELGWRAEAGVCVECNHGASRYALCYIVLILAVLTVCNYYCVRPRTRRKLVHGLPVVAVEGVIACVLTLLTLSPSGSLDVNVCKVAGIRDFYTAFFDPIGLDCTHEAVYPLWSGPLVLLAYHAPLAVLVRVAWSYLLRDPPLAKSALYTLLMLPAMGLALVLLSGVLYYSFPYVLLCLGLELFRELVGADGSHSLQSQMHWLVAPLVVFLLLGFAVCSITVFFDHRDELLAIGCLLPLLPSGVLVVQRIRSG